MEVIWFTLCVMYFGIVFCAVCENNIDNVIKMNKVNSCLS